LTRFTEVLERFVAAVVASDGAALGALFTPDGVYVDELFGAHHGRAAIAAMLQRFHDTGRDYRWDFCDPVSDDGTGYARFRFSSSRDCRNARGGGLSSRASASSVSRAA